MFFRKKLLDPNVKIRELILFYKLILPTKSQIPLYNMNTSLIFKCL